MAKTLGTLFGALVSHLVTVLFLSAVALFVYNFGVVTLIGVDSISFLTTTAVMLGIHALNLFVLFYVNRYYAFKLEALHLEAMKEAMMIQEANQYDFSNLDFDDEDTD